MIKRLVIAIGVLMVFLAGVALGNDGISKEDLARKEQIIEAADYKLTKAQDENKDLREKISSLETDLNSLEETTKEYTSLTENEKKIVDEKIVEVKNATQEQKEAEQRVIEEEKARKEAEEKAKKEAEEKAKEEQRKQTEYGNVIKTAQNYVQYMSFSRQGLIKQLEFEGYSTEASEYAVDNISVDWNEQCAKTAKKYLECVSFSRDGLYNQLAFEGFTDEQIQYSLSQVGY